LKQVFGPENAARQTAKVGFKSARPRFNELDAGNQGQQVDAPWRYADL
jgi:hypothetical protein